MFKDRDLCRPPTALRILQPANFRDAHRPKPVFRLQPLYIRESIASLQTTTTDPCTLGYQLYVSFDAEIKTTITRQRYY